MRVSKLTNSPTSVRITLIAIMAFMTPAGCRRGGNDIVSNSRPANSEVEQAKQAEVPIERCGTRPMSAAQVRDLGKKLQSFNFRKELGDTERVKRIKVYFHVINKGKEPVDDGNVALEQIEKQMEVLNEKFEGTGFQFDLADEDIKRPNKPDWYWMGRDSLQEAAAMQDLGVKQKDVLNVYTAHTKLRGWAVYPPAVRQNPYRDGVVIYFATLPGGFADFANQGKTLVHEVGHWLGLFHTYENGCDPLGDDVEDTPAEASPAPSNSCVYKQRNSCAGDNDYDPVHNFMDNSPDDCLSEFTPGQLKRMNMMFEMYRSRPW